MPTVNVNASQAITRVLIQSANPLTAPLAQFSMPFELTASHPAKPMRSTLMEHATADMVTTRPTLMEIVFLTVVHLKSMSMDSVNVLLD